MKYRLLLSVLFCILLSQNIFAKEKIMKINNVNYKIDITAGTACVTKNFKGKSIKGTAKGDVIIADTIVYKKNKYPVTAIENIAFLGCDKVTSITIPSTINTIGSISPFPRYSTFKEFKVTKGNTGFHVIDGVLFTKDLKILVAYPRGKMACTYTVTPTVEKIYQGAFSGIQELNTILLPLSLQQIDERGFEDCNSLKSITIPYSCKSIGKSAFERCYSLELFKYELEDIAFGEDVFKGCTKLSEENIIYAPPAKILIAKANTGNTKDQYYLAQCYEQGKGFETNLSEAFAWYQKAADQGDGESQYKVATMLEKGLGTEAEIKLSIQYYMKAADNGIIRAQCCVGKWYLNGVNVKQDNAKGIDYLCKAALQDNLEACSIIGNIYYNGSATLQKNVNNAIKFLSKSADIYPNDAYIVGISYNNGDSIPKNETLALKFLEKAVEGGIEEAKKDYCNLMYNSAVASIDSKLFNTAISSFTKVLKYDPNNVLAYLNRGYCYLSLSPIDYDNGEADCKRVLVLEPSNTIAKQNLDVIDQHRKIFAEAERLYGLGSEYFRARDYQSAVNYMLKAAELNPKDYYYGTIGNAFYNCKQYDDAINFYNKALSINPNNDEAKQNIKDARQQKKNDAIIAGLNALAGVMQSVNNIVQISQGTNNSTVSSTSTPARATSRPNSTSSTYTSPTTPTYTDISPCDNRDCKNGWDEHYKEKCNRCNGTGKIKYNNVTQKWVSSDY